MTAASVVPRRVAILIVFVCVALLLTLPGTGARRARRSSRRYTDRGTQTESPGFTYYFVLVVIIFGGILVLVCCLLNSLRLVEKVMARRSKKRTRRRQGGGAAGDQPAAGYQRDAVDPLELEPPPSYADVIDEATAPPPPYSSLHVGDAGWK